MRNITLRQLAIFEAVARHGSFTRAAESLHLTPPAVSMQVKSLEETAGLPLTEQIGKSVRLTPAGEELANLSRRLDMQVRESEEALAAMKNAAGGCIVVGAVSNAKYFAPFLMAEFKRRHPGVDLRLKVNNRGTLVRQLADNSIDLAIMGTPPSEFATFATTFADHPLVFISAPDHPLVSADSIGPSQLVSETLLIREPGSGTRNALERFLASQDLSGKETAAGQFVEMDSNETIKQSVMAGLGIALISAHTIRLELSAGHISVLKIVGTPLMSHWHLVHRAEKRLLPATEAFRAFICSEGAHIITRLNV